MKILIVEDDPVICDAVARHLETWGCTCSSIHDFGNVIQEFLDFDPQLVLMDITLPFFNGYHWCSEIRKVSKVPIIFISSASDNMNIVMAMNMGGDDFISKPFSLDVLTAKVQAMLRRTYDFVGQTSVFSHNGAVLNTGDTTLSFDSKKLDLTKNEYIIMQALMASPGKIVPRELLMQKIWESDCFIDENTLTVNVSRLRKKLDSIGLVDYIKTKKGIGYMV